MMGQKSTDVAHGGTYIQAQDSDVHPDHSIFSFPRPRAQFTQLADVRGIRQSGWERSDRIVEVSDELWRLLLSGTYPVRRYYP